MTIDAPAPTHLTVDEHLQRATEHLYYATQAYHPKPLPHHLDTDVADMLVDARFRVQGAHKRGDPTVRAAAIETLAAVMAVAHGDIWPACINQLSMELPVAKRAAFAAMRRQKYRHHARIYHSEVFRYYELCSDTTEQRQAILDSQLAVQDSIAAYRKALSKLQDELPIIEHNQEMTFRDGRKGSYASNDAIQEQLGPIIRKHGFVLSFSTSYPNGMIRVTGELAHKDGCAKTSDYEARVDLSGGKTDAQGRGSIISYGHRYTTRDLLNLITRGDDNNGATDVQPEEHTPKPDGYLYARSTIANAARGGTRTLETAWASLTPVMRAAIPEQFWRDCKATAEGYDAGVF